MLKNLFLYFGFYTVFGLFLYFSISDSLLKSQKIHCKNGIEGISASKMRELAMRGDEKNFIRMTPLPTKLAKTMYDEVRKGMGVQKEPA